MSSRPPVAPASSDGEGLEFTVGSHHAPGLVLEHGGGRLLRITCAGTAVFWVRVDARYQGLWHVRRREPRSLGVVRPIRAQEARAIRTPEAWMRWFAQHLEASAASPLRPGRWCLTELRQESRSIADRDGQEPLDVWRPVGAEGLPGPAYNLRGCPSSAQGGYESWGINGSGTVLALRPSISDSARVKSRRKHARGGSLPPILLWWIGGFDAHVVLDGHDRLRAALLERAEPTAITLWQPYDERPREARWREEAVRHYEKVFAFEERLSERSRVDLNRNLVATHRRWRRSQTTARAQRGLREDWLREVRSQLPKGSPLARQVCGEAGG